MQKFEQLFEEAAGHPPYRFQTRLASGERIPQVLNVPTGAGKTAAAFFAWLWRRRFHPDPAIRSATPRRLVYCLPMRVLVEQTLSTVNGYLEALDLAGEIGTHVLMGGDVDDDWQLYPDRDTVIIGTQDMLLSRALNRGYAMNRFRWPLTYALLNNDTLWVIDEIQLMGAGMPTTAQLEAFRKQFDTHGPTHTMWMSATIRPDWLQTVNHQAPEGEEIFQLEQDEREERRIKSGLEACKILSRIEMRSGVNARGYPDELVQKTLERHTPGTQTLLIVNTVARAQAASNALQKLLSKAFKDKPLPETLLLHSRFRPHDRSEKVKLLTKSAGTEGGGRIVISTQVVEAGVDITSACLVTELAPWSSMVQRFGRCNRYGETQEARVYWVDLSEKGFMPYEAGPMETARQMLSGLEGGSVSPSLLPAPDDAVERHQVLRRKDLLELFDTAPDLSGNDVDVSRFIRTADDTGVHLCWREWEGSGPPPREEPRPQRDELCPAPIGQFRDFMKNEKTPWLWDYRDRRWRRVNSNELFPGQILMLHVRDGGYDPLIGWNPVSGGKVSPVPLQLNVPAESGGDDRHTFTGSWQTLAEHSKDVVTEVDLVASSIGLESLNGHITDELKAAALWHDLGKAHPVFQETLLEGSSEEEKTTKKSEIWAKSPSAPGRPFLHSRPHFRHELASMLALCERQDELGLSDLTLYLVAAHHGKVRLAIRSIPGSDGHPGGASKPLAILGIEEGDRLPPVKLSDSQSLSETTLSLKPAQLGMENGKSSWLARTLELLDEHGAFRLAYLEALVRIADIRASIKAAGGHYNE